MNLQYALFQSFIPFISFPQAGIASPDSPDQLLISLEPEAASISVRREKFHELVPDASTVAPLHRSRRGGSSGRRSATPGGGRRSATPAGRGGGGAGRGARSSVSPDRGRRHSEPKEPGQGRKHGDLNSETGNHSYLLFLRGENLFVN